MTQFTFWLFAGVCILAIAAVGVLGFQSVRLVRAQSDLSSMIDERDAARAAVRSIAHAKIVTERELSAERNAAVAAERRAAKLQLKIDRDAGTVRDAPTAPVLDDTIHSLGAAE